MSTHIPLTRIDDNPYQPRLSYDDAYIDDLAADIERNGLMQPLVGRVVNGAGKEVTPASVVSSGKWSPDGVPDYRIQLAFGHNRLRALRLLHERTGNAEWATAPVSVRLVDDEKMATMAYAENAARKDLTALEEAKAFRRAIDDFGWTQEEAATHFGVSRSALANKLRLLRLPERVLEYLSSGDLTERQAAALIPAFTLSDDQAEILECARETFATNPYDPEALLKLAIIHDHPSDSLRAKVDHLVNDTIPRYRQWRQREEQQAREEEEREAATPPRDTVSIKTPVGTFEVETEKVEEFDSGPSYDRKTVAVHEPVEPINHGYPVPELPAVAAELEGMTKAQLEQVYRRFDTSLYHSLGASAWYAAAKKREMLSTVRRLLQWCANLEAAMRLTDEQLADVDAWMREQFPDRYSSPAGLHVTGLRYHDLRDVESAGFLSDEATAQLRLTYIRLTAALCYDRFLEDVAEPRPEPAPDKPKLIDVYPYMVPCPYHGCNAKAGQHCGRPSGHRGPLVQPHAARREAADAYLEGQEEEREPTAREWVDEHLAIDGDMEGLLTSLQAKKRHLKTQLQSAKDRGAETEADRLRSNAAFVGQALQILQNRSVCAQTEEAA